MTTFKDRNLEETLTIAKEFQFRPNFDEEKTFYLIENFKKGNHHESQKYLDKLFKVGKNQKQNVFVLLTTLNTNYLHSFKIFRLWQIFESGESYQI